MIQILIKTKKNCIYTMMLLMGMWINRTKNPINPKIANPITVATAVLRNSENQNENNFIQEGFAVCKNTWLINKRFAWGTKIFSSIYLLR